MNFVEEINELLDLRSAEAFHYSFGREWPVHCCKWMAFEEILVRAGRPFSWRWGIDEEYRWYSLKEESK